MTTDLDSGKPNPDPTVLTTEQLLREIARLEKLLETQLRSEHELLVAKLDGRAALVAEQFHSVETQFALVERQRVEQKQDTKAAVDAALAAAKEAVKEQTTASEARTDRSEAATTKQLEQQSATFSTAIKGVADLLQDTKDRVGSIENYKQGATEQRTETRAITGAQVAMFGLLVAIAALLVAVLLRG